MKKDNIKSRNYCFTINNYRKADLKHFHKLAEGLSKHRYICFGLEEAPTTGTKHIQGYIQLKDAQRLTFLHQYFSFMKDGKVHKFHIEIANGTPAENKQYCQKQGAFFEFGEPVTQGARNDLSEIKEKVKSDPKNINAIVDEHGNNYQQIKYIQTLQPFYLPQRNPDTPPIVFWIFGPSGVGKSRLVYDTFSTANVCNVSSYRWPGNQYVQQDCLLFDDFRKGDMPFHTILKITDRFPFTLECKGGHIPLNSPFIIFTSPHSVDETFEASGEDLQQLKRRMIQIHLDSKERAGEIDLRNLDPKHHYNPETGCYPAW